MRRATPLQAKSHLVFLVIAVLVVIADQLTKAWIRSNLALGETLFETPFFRLTNIHNTGAAFGMFRGFSSILTVISIIGASCILVYVFVIHRRYPVLDSRLGWIALGLILGGTIGNLIDRLLFGYVTDFLDFVIWPAFNVADSSVTIGVIVFACYLLFLNKSISHSRTES